MFVETQSTLPKFFSNSLKVLGLLSCCYCCRALMVKLAAYLQSCKIHKKVYNLREVILFASASKIIFFIKVAQKDHMDRKKDFKKTLSLAFKIIVKPPVIEIFFSIYSLLCSMCVLFVLEYTLTLVSTLPIH